MIPGSDLTMQAVIKFHITSMYKDTYKTVFLNKPALAEKIRLMGFSDNPRLSELDVYFRKINKLEQTFEKKCVLAGKSNLAKCLDNKISELKSKYEIKPIFPKRLIFPQPNPLLEVDVRDALIRWPPAYVSFHCWQEGYDVQLYDLGFLYLFEVSGAEAVALKSIEPFLFELYRGVSHAIFLDKLIVRRSALSHCEPTDHDKIESIQEQVIFALKPLRGNNFVNQKIMTNKEFERLLNYTLHLVEHEALPSKIVPITPTQIPTQFIRKTYQLLHQKLYGKNRREYWFDFLYRVFEQFSDVALATTKKHFTSYTGNFEQDRKKLLSSQESPKSQ